MEAKTAGRRVRKTDSVKRGRAAASSPRQPNDEWNGGKSVEVRTVVKPVQNAIAILRYLSASGEPGTATKISSALGINTSTCFNILRTLAGEDVVRFDSTTKTYKVGIGLLNMASNVLSEENRLAATRERLRAFADAHGATICVWRRVSEDRNILIATEHGPGNVRIHLQIGQTLPVLLGSTGRVMVGHLGLSKTQVRAKFRKLRWFSAPNFEQYWRESQESIARGWAVDDGNFSAGVLTVSAPIIGRTGGISYSLTALTFRDQHRNESVEELGNGLVELTDEVGMLLY